MTQTTRTMTRALLAIVGLILANPLWADKPLHKQIDQLIAAGTSHGFARVADDATFLRRVYLDLAGDLPSATEARSFLESKDRNKRTALVDSLLADPRYGRNMAERMHVMLMERRGTNEHWSNFLKQSFLQNKPWDKLVQAIIDPSTDEEATNGSNFFLTRRLEKYGQNPTDFPGLAADIGRLFLGVDLQCAQCHDHLFIDDYKQADFQGMYAFALNTFVRRDTKFPAIGERVMKAPLEFQSVFGGEPQKTGPRIFRGKEVEVATFEKGEELKPKTDPDSKAPGVPKFSPLRILAKQLPTDQNRFFARNCANRLWYLMMGHGIVYPLDMDHSDNPPSHPELLDLLTEQLIEQQFNVQWLLREIALSETYQRSGLLPKDATPVQPAEYRTFKQKGLSAEQLCWSMLRATGELDRVTADEDEVIGLPAVRAKFMAAYANPPREPELKFTPAVRAALFLLNDETIVQWTMPREGNLAEKLTDMTDNSAVAEELYLAIFSRFPASEESETVNQHLKQAEARAAAVSQLVWALLASVEFATNH
jgi:hypothetical protein